MDQREQRMRGVYIITGVAVVFAMLLVVFGKEDPAKEKESNAFYAAREFVRQELVAPSTAEFAPRDQSIVRNDGLEYYVTSYVDAQNAFGARLRKHYMVVLQDEGKNWRKVKLEME